MKYIFFKVISTTKEFDEKYSDLHWFCDAVDVLHNGMIALGKSTLDSFAAYFRDDVSNETIAKAKIELESFGLKLVLKTEQ